MGKPIRESLAEIEKSIGMVDYLIDNTQAFMKDEEIKTKFQFRTYARHQPLGPILSKILCMLRAFRHHAMELPSLASNQTRFACPDAWESHTTQVCNECSLNG